MTLDVPHQQDTVGGVDDQCYPTSEAQPSVDEPEWRRYRETLRVVYRYHPSIPLTEAPQCAAPFDQQSTESTVIPTSAAQTTGGSANEATLVIGERPEIPYLSPEILFFNVP